MLYIVLQYYNGKRHTFHKNTNRQHITYHFIIPWRNRSGCNYKQQRYCYSEQP